MISIYVYIFSQLLPRKAATIGRKVYFHMSRKGQSWHVIWWLWKPWPHGAAVSDLPRQKSNFPQNKEVQFSIHFCSILCIKYFLICKIKRYVIMFFVYKNRFLARQIGPVMAFIPDNISVHVHPITESDPIKPENAMFLCLLIWVVYFTRKVEMNEYNGPSYLVCIISSPELKAHGWAYSIPVTPASVRPSSVRQHFQTSSLKPLGQLNSNFIWRLLRTRERKFVQMVLVTWPRWPPCPYMVKTL